VYHVFIVGSICFPLQGAAWGLFDLLSGFYLNILQYNWFLRDVRAVCGIIQAMNFFLLSVQGLAVHLEAYLAPRPKTRSEVVDNVSGYAVLYVVDDHEQLLRVAKPSPSQFYF
jgi:hypothetical protein